MVPTKRKPAALIVDVDVGFIFWFGEIITKAGWNLVPALNCRQGVALAVMLDSYIDVIVVNPALIGIHEMVESLSRVHRPMVVVVRDSKVEPGFHADGTIDRPDMGTQLSRIEAAETVRKLMRELI